MEIMKWIVLAFAIAAIVATEKLVRSLKSPFQVALAGRIQYPIWALLGLDAFVDTSWLLALYGLAIGLVALRGYSLLKLRAELLQDAAQLVVELRQSRQLVQEAIAEIKFLEQHGCPAGLDCRQMGNSGKRCQNYRICKIQGVSDRYS